MPRLRKPIKIPGLNRPHPWRDGEDPIPCFTPKPPPQDGDIVPDELDDAGISLDYDATEICAVTFAQIIGEELHEDDVVELDDDGDCVSVTIGVYKILVFSSLGSPAALRLAEALHALGEALRHSAGEE